MIYVNLLFQPPIGEEGVEKLGKWVKREFCVRGNWWDSSCTDIAASGLGWFAIGLRGEARLGVWTYDGVEVIVRNALLPQRSHIFEEAGFTVSKIVSKADQNYNKQSKNAKKKRKTVDSTFEPAEAEKVVTAESILLP